MFENNFHLIGYELALHREFIWRLALLGDAVGLRICVWTVFKSLWIKPSAKCPKCNCNYCGNKIRISYFTMCLVSTNKILLKNHINVSNAGCLSEWAGGAVRWTLYPESRGQTSALCTWIGDDVTKRYLYRPGVC